MTRAVALLAATVLSGAVAASGCGLGPGESREGTAHLRVTRDFGQALVADGTLQDPTESDTVVRFLDDNADIGTSYGGNFVDTIDGLEGSTVGGGDHDWFFFVNGYYSDIGAGESRVNPGDRIWWDYRDWAQAYRVPAVVGSWPEPFLDGRDGRRLGVVVECIDAGQACAQVTGSLEDAGVTAVRTDASRPTPHPSELRILVGDWSHLRDDPAAAQVEDGPETSGVYARMDSCGAGYRLQVLDPSGRTALTSDSAGLVAAVREQDDQPTWLVTGTDGDAVAAAAGLLDEEHLQDRYAVAIETGGDAALPVPAPAGEVDAGPGGCR